MIKAVAKADTRDNYQLYLNNVLVRNDSGFPTNGNDIAFLTLYKSVYNTTMDIYFNLCTRGATNRKIIVISKDKKKLSGGNIQTKLLNV